MLRLPSVVFSAGFVIVAGCAGTETAVGKGGFDFTDAGGTCTPGDACELPGKIGACAIGAIVCSESGQGSCEGPAPSGETCNGIDDDCNGLIDEMCGLTFVHFLPTGNTSAGVSSSLFPANGSATKTVVEILGSDPGDGWLHVTSASPLPIGGTASNYAQATGPALMLMPTVAPDNLARNVIVPGYRQGGPGPTYSHALTLVNAGGATATITVTVNPDGAAPVSMPLTLPKDGSVRTDVPALIGTDPMVLEEGWLSISSDQDLAVAYEEASSALADKAGDAAWATPAKNVLLPYFHANANVTSTLRIANPDPTTASVTVRVHKRTGEVLESAMIMLPSMMRFIQSLEVMFPGGFATGGRGWIEIVADVAVAAHVLVEDAAAGGMALVGPVVEPVPVLYAAGITIDTALGKTPVVVLGNPGAEATTAVVEAFDAGGSWASQTSSVIAGGGAYVASLDTLLGMTTFSGWLRLMADRPIIGAYTQQGGAPGLGVTALHDKLSNEAIIPVVLSPTSGQQTEVTLIQPERRSF